jgi:exopolyphosphatase/guanosine-5'-triphosphate,3'-diphosphate pyrophosphatase
MWFGTKLKNGLRQIRSITEVTLIGSGGNINKLFKMSGKTKKTSILYLYLTSQYSFLNSLTYEQRISELLNPIVQMLFSATRIYLNAMKWSGARQIYVPKIGLSIELKAIG